MKRGRRNNAEGGGASGGGGSSEEHQEEEEESDGMTGEGSEAVSGETTDESDMDSAKRREREWLQPPRSRHTRVGEQFS